MKTAAPLILSFDVFDTLITRIVGRPTTLFFFLGKELRQDNLIAIPPSEFQRERIEAEQIARGKASGGEVTLREICEQLASQLGEGDSEELMRRELEMEARFLRPMPGAARLLEIAREKSPRILFVSDMYLPSSFIQETLSRFGLWRDGDRCFLSCEYGSNKATGGLFREILADEFVKGSTLLHSGDNYHVDVHGASLAKVAGRHLPEGLLNRYELLITDDSDASPGARALLAGASRLTRLSLDFSTPGQNVLRDISASVIGPVLTSFIEWVLMQAEERGIERLYFISRDGFILKDMAVRMRPEEGGPEIRYLYGSRQAWHIPAITSLDDDECDWIFEETAFRSVSSIFARMDCPADPLKDELTAEGFPPARWNEALSPAEADRLRGWVRKNERVMEVLRPVLAKTRALTIAYLRQEGLLDGKRWAFVDLGWNGRLQESLLKLLGSEGLKSITGFYFALKAGARGAEFNEKHAFLFDLRESDASYTYIPDLFSLMESFCCAPHGSVRGYLNENGQIAPQFRDGHAEQLAAWGLPVVHDTLRKYSELVSTDAWTTARAESCRALVERLMMEFSCHPSPAEAAAWGAFPYEDDQAGSYTDRFAVPLSLSSRSIATGLREGRLARPTKVSWMGGCKAMTPTAALAGLRVFSLIGKARQSLAGSRT